MQTQITTEVGSFGCLLFFSYFFSIFLIV